MVGVTRSRDARITTRPLAGTAGRAALFGRIPLERSRGARIELVPEDGRPTEGAAASA